MNSQDQFDNWTKQWEKAQEDGIFANAPKPPQVRPQHSADFFGQYPTLDAPANQSDLEYWKQVYDRSRHQGDAPDLAGEEVITEQRATGRKVVAEQQSPSKKELGEVAKKLFNGPNPIYPYSLGKDQDLKVTDNWTDGKELVELNNIRVELEKLESKLNALEGLGKSGKDVEGKIAQLRNKADELSDSLKGDKFGDTIG